jgi:hypothetical protein
LSYWPLCMTDRLTDCHVNLAWAAVDRKCCIGCTGSTVVIPRSQLKVWADILALLRRAWHPLMFKIGAITQACAQHKGWSRTNAFVALPRELWAQAQRTSTPGEVQCLTIRTSLEPLVEHGYTRAHMSVGAHPRTTRLELYAKHSSGIACKDRSSKGCCLFNVAQELGLCFERVVISCIRQVLCGFLWGMWHSIRQISLMQIRKQEALRLPQQT